MPFDNNHSHEEWNCESGNNPENESERLSEREKSLQYRFLLVRDRQSNCFFKLFLFVFFSFTLFTTSSSSSSSASCVKLMLFHPRFYQLDCLFWKKNRGTTWFHIIQRKREQCEMMQKREPTDGREMRREKKHERKENDTSSMENKYLF